MAFAPSGLPQDWHGVLGGRRAPTVLFISARSACPHESRRGRQRARAR